jgi:hypothetical protein
MPASGYPTPPLVGGTTARAAIFEGYVFQSGIQGIEHSKILTYKYPQYYMTALLDKLGAAEPVARDVFSWSIQDRTRLSATYTAIANGTNSKQQTLTLDTVAVSPNLGYFQVGDVIRVGKTGALGLVAAIAIAGGFQTIDVTRPDGSNWAVGVLPAVNLCRSYRTTRLLHLVKVLTVLTVVCSSLWKMRTTHKLSSVQ